MKKYLLITLALLLVMTPISCSREETSTTAPASSPREIVTCAISYPTLLESGDIQMSSCMEDYPAGSMEQALKTGLNGKTTVTFDEEGNIASIGELKAEGGNHFAIRTIASNGQPTTLTEKPADITLDDFVSYEIYYADQSGEQLNRR